MIAVSARRLHLAFTHPLAIGPIMTSRSIARTALLAALLPLTGACSLFGGNNGPSDTAYIARDVESLYTEAKERLDRGDVKIAAALFDEVERQHPYSPWARRAQLMSAFCYYLQKDYTKAIESSQRFLQIHPGNKDAPYAYYLIALSYYEQINDVDRDQKITEQALTALNDIQRRYPGTEYASDARLKADLVNDHLAGKEMEIGRFYERSGQWLAAQLRFRNVVETYQTTSHTAEALYRLTETNLALGLPTEAKKYAAVLGANYPGSEWYEKAYQLMGEEAPATLGG
jgi:outer membrane protein assembly factor BamD